MAGQRVQVAHLERVRSLRAWCQGSSSHWRYLRITYGESAQGWFAQRIGQGWSGAWLLPDERACCEAIEAWMRAKGGEWVRTPAAYDGRGLPTDSDTVWYGSGNRWIYGEPPEGFTGQVVRNHD